MQRLTRRGFMAQAATVSIMPRLVMAKEVPLAGNRLALLSDTHITPADATPRQREYFARSIQRVLAANPRPANVILCGDLAYMVGLREEYKLLRELLRPLDDAGIKWHPVLGNHDRRTAFYEYFPEFKKSSPVPGRVVSVVETPRADFILVDSCLAPDDSSGINGPSEGGIDQGQIDWLKKELAVRRKPLFVAAHHPISPFLNAPISWLKKHQAAHLASLSTGQRMAWDLKLEEFTGMLPLGEALNGAAQVVAYIHGHNHYWYTFGEKPAVPAISLPSTGHNGDIGHVMVDLGENAAEFKLWQHEFLGTLSYKAQALGLAPKDRTQTQDGQILSVNYHDRSIVRS